MIVKTTFWILLFFLFYSYLGYPFILMFLVLIKKAIIRKKNNPKNKDDQSKTICIIIPAYNELDWLEQKYQNTKKLIYPKNKIQIIFVIDGSDDGSYDYLRQYKDIKLLYKPERKGKMAAMNQAASISESDILVFTDVNTLINETALEEIIKIFDSKEVACVAGKKQVISNKKDNSSATGESMYWIYESLIKEMESYLSSTVSVAGELFAIRRVLYQNMNEDTLVDDLVLSLELVKKNYKIKYAKNAIATETASKNIKEELKRKKRIATGAIQTLFRYSEIMNIFKYGFYSFQFISHKIFRWIILPISLILLLPVNLIVISLDDFKFNSIYVFFLFLQIVFYIFAMIGYLFRNINIKNKILFMPFYIIVYNISMFFGFYNYIANNQSVKWEKAERKI